VSNGWGGKRKGAGRRRDEKSLRAISAVLSISPYHVRQIRKLKAAADALDPKLWPVIERQIMNREATVREARALLVHLRGGAPLD
jgi:hypothetical protein